MASPAFGFPNQRRAVRSEIRTLARGLVVLRRGGTIAVSDSRLMRLMRWIARGGVAIDTARRD
ncbi:hypothetical protein [Azospirillum cavernae]|uniref:hypothetical protein n=1 Tax=Azospirillum cavernae TaxID=2320860 RepID=UPI0011C3CB52|nr:hypothetical protein [Azospirillum cavernae]